MKNKFHKWLKELNKHKRRILISLFFLVIALVFYGLAGNYVTDKQNSVISPDLILDNFGPYDLSFVYVWFFLLIMSILVLYPLIFKPNELPYVITIFSLFVVVRSGFTLFTHLKVPLDAIPYHFPHIFQVFIFSNDLFFSGHTGIPFLGFLLFKENKRLSYFMLSASIILGITVLLMHVHYSIDVFSAFFITYGTYKLGERFIQR